MFFKTFAVVGLSLMLMSQFARADYDAGMAAYSSHDFGKAQALLAPDARAGNLIAQNLMGVMLMNGDGSPRDDAAALGWFVRAAASGYAVAQTNAGFMYEYGRGAPRNLELAKSWYEKAAAQGDSRAKLFLQTLGRGSALQVQPGTLSMAAAHSRQPTAQLPLAVSKSASPALTTSSGSVRAAAVQDAPLRALPGDGIAKIQMAYTGSPAPVPFSSADPANKQVLRLRDNGIWFFLTSEGVINIVRLDPPFGGAINGIHLGDRLDEVQRILGSAGKPLSVASQSMITLPPSSYIFATDLPYRIRVDLGADRRVHSILLIR